MGPGHEYPGKLLGLNALTTHKIELQWGRGMNTPENAKSAPNSHFKIAASMGPGHEYPGKRF